MASAILVCCSKCGIEQPPENFYYRKDTGKIRGNCKKCTAEWSAKHYKTHKPQHRIASRKYSIRINYGLSMEAVADLMERQDSSCKICKTYIGESYAFDHDHTTGVVRALLCRPCNIGLGLFKDSPARLHAAFEYLKYKLHRGPTYK